MQAAFSFDDVDDLTWMGKRLQSHFGEMGPILYRIPIGQLVKSLISGRTRDGISLDAFDRLTGSYAAWSDVAAAPLEDIETLIRDVTFPDAKARYLRETLRIIATSHPDFELAFLGRLTVAQALNWLECLPGVGRKVAASTLNFSTLAMPAFVIDTHILRILRRYGMVGARADTPVAFDAVMALAGGWSAVDLAELHVFMKRLGQTVCMADHALCADCPLRLRCKLAVRRNRDGRSYPNAVNCSYAS